MQNQDFLQLGAANSSLPNLGQPQSNFLPNDLIQPPDTNLNRLGSFSEQIKAEIADIRVKIVDYDQYVHENVFGNSASEFLASTTTSEFLTTLDGSDILTGDFTSVNSDAVLDLAVTTAKQQLESFADEGEFFDNMNLAFGNDLDLQQADALIQDIASGEVIPEIKILPAATLNANGAFGEGAIYISDEFLTENAANPEAVAGVLLEEIGHYVDLELNSVDSPGDEGNIFASLVQGETIAEAELTITKAEDDSAIILLKGKELAVELAESPSPIGTPDAVERRTQAALADAAASYPGYNLAYDPSAPEYNEDPAVVRLWQQRMQNLGYAIEVDGYYGEQSVQVARQFQAKNGLEVDGYVGPNTWAASFSLGTPTASSERSPSPTPTTSADAIEARNRSEQEKIQEKFDYSRFEETLEYMHQEMITNINEVDTIRSANEIANTDVESLPFWSRLGFYSNDPRSNASSQALSIWALKVRPGGEWDHKPKLEDMLEFEKDENGKPKENFDFPIPGDEKHEYYYDIWSNIHYGYVGTAAGFDPQTLQAGATIPVIAGKNDPGDILSVQIGIELWEKHGSNLSPEHLHRAILDHTDDYKTIQHRYPTVRALRELNNRR